MCIILKMEGYMTEQQFRRQATEKVKQIVDCIADHEYAKLEAITEIDMDLYHCFSTKSEAIEKITEWLDRSLCMWSEAEHKEYVIDHFDEKYFILHWIKEKSAFGSFMPHSYGETLDFLFEFEFVLEDHHVICNFSMNI